MRAEQQYWQLLRAARIDSVVHGGNFDGDVGSMGAIEVIRALNDGSVKTRHPLESGHLDNLSSD